MVFAADLVEAYPEAKVILVERDMESWYRSWTSTIVAAVWSPFMKFAADSDPSWLGAIGACQIRRVRGWYRANRKQEILDISRQMYREHFALVRRVTHVCKMLCKLSKIKIKIETVKGGSGSHEIVA